MIYKTWQQLEKDFAFEIKNEWAGMYPRPEFVSRIIKKTFYYYDRAGNSLHTKADWKRAIDKFLSTNWVQEQNQTNRKENKFVPRQVPSGPDYIPFQRSDVCSECDDLRTIRVISLDDTHESLMLCECTKSSPDIADWGLPLWSYHWGQLYKRTKCPVEWFKPEPGNLHSLWQKARSWGDKVRIARMFWVELKKTSQNDPV